MLWSAETLVVEMAASLAGLAGSRDEEGASRGIDALDEVLLQEHLATSLKRSGFGVWPEERFPSGRHQRRRNAGRRCDLVLTPGGRPLVPGGPPRLLPPPADCVPLDEAYWLEIKLARQFSRSGGGDGYAGHLSGSVVDDVLKLCAEQEVTHAGLLIIIFCRDAATALHDLLQWQLICRERDLPVASPARVGQAISDRLGHTHAEVALFPIRPALAP